MRNVILGNDLDSIKNYDSANNVLFYNWHLLGVKQISSHNHKEDLGTYKMFFSKFLTSTHVLFIRESLLGFRYIWYLLLLLPYLKLTSTVIQSCFCLYCPGLHSLFYQIKFSSTKVNLAVLTVNTILVMSDGIFDLSHTKWWFQTTYRFSRF